MSYNGSGVFNINTAGQPVVTGTVISSTAFNALTADLATGLSTAITKDGQTTTTARITFAQGISSTLVTDATSSTTGSIITAGGMSCQKALNVGTTTTLGGALTYGGVTLSNAVTGTGNMVLSANATHSGNLTVTNAGATQIIAQSTTNSTYPTLYLKANNRSWWTSAVDSGTDAPFQIGTGAIPGTNSLFAIGPTGTGVVIGSGSNPGAGAGTHDNILNVSGSTPSLTFGGSNAVGTVESINGASGAIVLNGASYVATQVNSSEKVRVNSSGLGIGMTPSNILDITQNQNTTSKAVLLNSNSGTAASAEFRVTNGTNNGTFTYLGTGYTTSGIVRQDGLYISSGGGAGGLTLSTGAAQPIYFSVNSSEVARFDTSGRLLVGTTTSGGWPGNSIAEFRTSAQGASFYNTANGSNNCGALFRVDYDASPLLRFYNSTNAAGQFITTGGATPNIQWIANNEAYVISGGSGGVKLTSGATAWASASDETLKTGLVAIQSGAEKVASLRAVTGRYKTDAESVSRSFLIAQDVQKVLPEAVSVDTDGTLSLRYSEVIPLLVAAIQELNVRINTLENN